MEAGPDYRKDWRQEYSKLQQNLRDLGFRMPALVQNININLARVSFFSPLSGSLTSGSLTAHGKHVGSPPAALGSTALQLGLQPQQRHYFASSLL